MKSQFDLENDQFLKFLLDKRFFDIFSNTNHKLWKAVTLELYITSDCNLKCEYCYLQKHKDSIYPKEIRDHKKIIHNLRLLLDYSIKKNYNYFTIDLFSGEIWGTKLGNAVFDELLRFMDKGGRIDNIMIPSNMTFLLNEQHTQLIESYIEEFSKHGCKLDFSASVDGKYLEDITRLSFNEKLNTARNDDYYDTVFEFCKKHNYLFHPMVSAENVKYWKKNYDWFIDMFKKHNYIDITGVMILEVRDNNWTDESIQDLLDFYDYQIDYFLKEFCNNDFNEFSVLLFNLDNANRLSSGYFNWALPTGKNMYGCSLNNTLAVRLGDLSIPPCHRTAYPQFIYGNFIVENDEIVDISANNYMLAARILYASTNSASAKCDVCIYKEYCMKGCLGSQYEDHAELLTPNESVCKMFKAKFNHLIDKYEEMGVFKYLESIPNNQLAKLSANCFLEPYYKLRNNRKLLENLNNGGDQI